MGDVGSFGIGLTVVYMLTTAISAGTSPLVLISLVAVPLIEVFSTVVMRIAAGRSPFHGDASHLSLRLLNSGRSACTVAIIFAACTAASGLFALAALYYAR
jgi:UDP-GlcNAc:undecaprenyl-phosphate GlcNAc-1-phosphate transferase